jgi:hypothetical protein
MKTIIIGAIMASFWAFAHLEAKSENNLAQHAASAIVTSK